MFVTYGSINGDMFEVLVVVVVGWAGAQQPPSSVIRFPIGWKALSGNMSKWLYLIL
jgi:hypothetical protein